MNKGFLLPLLLLSAALWAGGRDDTTVSDTGKKAIPIPQRIVSLSPSTTETLFAIGAGDQVVGVTSYCNYPPEAATRTIIGGFSPKTISVEKIISLNPDLVIAGVSAHHAIADTLKDAGIPVISVEPKSIEDVRSVIEQLAVITGHEKQGKALSDDIGRRLDTVEKKLATLKGKKLRVFYEVWDSPLMTAGPSSFTGQLIACAGGENIFSDVQGDYPTVSSEELLKRNPQVIISSDGHGDKLTGEALEERDGWEQIDAYRNNRIILLNDDIVSRPGPRMIEAVEQLAAALYPDLF